MVVTITEIFYPKTRSEWRNWLKTNHNTKEEIWITYYKKATKKPTVAYKDAVKEALCFGWIDGIEKSIDSERYAQRFTPRKLISNWSETNIKRYNELLQEGLMTQAGIDAFKRKP